MQAQVFVIEDQLRCNVVRHASPAEDTFEDPVPCKMIEQLYGPIVFLLPKQWRTNGYEQKQNGTLHGFRFVCHPG
jgi:hypothetical protein